MMDLDFNDQSLSTFVRDGTTLETIQKIVEGKKEVLALEKDILLTKIAEDQRKDARKDKVTILTMSYKLLLHEQIPKVQKD
jgi:hypothetical protein